MGRNEVCVISQSYSVALSFPNPESPCIAGGLAALKGGKGAAGKGGGKGGKGGGDEDAALKLPTMHISVQAQTVVEMIYQTLGELETADEDR